MTHIRTSNREVFHLSTAGTFGADGMGHSIEAVYFCFHFFAALWGHPSASAIIGIRSCCLFLWITFTLQTAVDLMDKAFV